MAVQLVDAIASSQRSIFAMFARAATYTRGPDGPPVAVAAYVRGIRADDLFGAAAQGDIAGQVDALKFAAAFGAGATPARFDRLRTMGKSYSVEEWRGSPNDDAPVFFKMLLRGGGQ